MEIRPYSKNAKEHPPEQIEKIARSISEFGMNQQIVVDTDGVIIVGHGRYEALKHLGMEIKPEYVKVVDLPKEKADAYRLADNKLNESDWDMELVVNELRELDLEGYDIEITGFDRSLLYDTPEGGGAGSMANKYLVPPFSVLNARSGDWQEKKREWLGMGITSEVGRDIDPTNVSKNAPAYMAGRGNNEGGSIFDPVLCEIVYKWFCTQGGTVLDPFAGGSVRGIVASVLGLKYTGIELRQEQVDANIEQGKAITPDNQPTWICGDSNKDIPNADFDLIFSCPPYADLEVYSDNENDLSNMPYNKFLEAYRSIIKKAVARLKDDRFAVFVVGEVRDKTGMYYNFVGDTIQAFIDAGMGYYNEAILVTPIGTLPLRAGKQFNASRKLGKTHQNILVFYKGSTKNIKDNYGELDLSSLEYFSPEDS